MTLDSYTSGKAMHVDVAAIEREITRLWKGAAEPGSEETAPVMRACLLNLLVVTGPDGSSPDLAKTLSAVVQARPCRLLLLQIDGALPPGSLDAWISAHCIVPSNGERQVCCEQITVRSSLDAAVHLPSLASALAASDLPILLWVPRWPPPDQEALDRLAGISGRVIVDSIGMTPSQLAATGSRHAAMGDLNWDRLLPFQWAVARAFDSHLLRPLASEIRGVATTGGDGSETASVLFTGWLRSVLGGRPLDRKHRSEPGAEPGLLRSAALIAGPDSSVIVETSPEGRMLTARAELPGTCPLPQRARFEEPGLAELLCRELDRMEPDPLYKKSLAA